MDKIFKISGQFVYVHTFRFVTPKQCMESLRYNFALPEDLHTVGEKLRYYRHIKGLKQSDVADYLKIKRGTYSEYEKLSRDYYEPHKMDKIAQLFNVDVELLLDEYNMFLYKGQGTYISTLRKKLKITQAKFAKIMNVSLSKVKRWEQNRTRMFKSTWEKMNNIFKQKIKKVKYFTTSFCDTCAII